MVSVSRSIEAPQAQVWAVLCDIARAGRWNQAWSKIEVTSQQTHGSGATFRAHTEDGATYDFLVSDWIAPEYIAFSPIRDSSERYQITLESQAFRLKPQGEDETLVELSAQASARGFRGRMIALLFWPGYQKHGLNAALGALHDVVVPHEEDEPDSEAAL